MFEYFMHCGSLKSNAIENNFYKSLISLDSTLSSPDTNECLPRGGFDNICDEFFNASCPNKGDCPLASPNMTCVNQYGGYECMCDIEGYGWSVDEKLCLSKYQESIAAITSITAIVLYNSGQK